MANFDVVLFSKYSFHDSILGPIATELEKLKINFWMTGKRHLVYDLFNERERKFSIVIIADEWTNLFRNQAEILITIGHSPASKHTTLDSKNSDADYIYTFSQFYKTEFLKRGVSPKKEMIVTGNPAASRLFRKEILKGSIWETKNCNLGLKVLFAPTYNKDLSIMDVLMEEEKNNQLFKQMHDYQIAFKLHPVLHKKYPEQAEFVKELSKTYGNVYYHENSNHDITDAILWSDVVIGDCSGALFLSIAGEKPVIAYNNPDRVRSPYYDQHGPEWIFRNEYAYQIESLNVLNLPNLIRGVLENDYKKEKRKIIVNLLFENQKDAEVVIARHIVSLL